LSQKGRVELHQIVSAWSTFAAALLALVAIGLQLSNSYFEKAQRKRGTEVLLSTLMQMLDGELSMEFDLNKSDEELQKEGKHIVWGPAEHKMYEELQVAYRQTDIFNSKEITALLDLLYALEVQTNPPVIYAQGARLLHDGIVHASSVLSLRFGK
jgi:hypothetical protein